MAKAATATKPASTTKPGDRVAPVLTAISANIPMPDRSNSKRGSTTSYPFASLEVGQSFGVKNKTQKQLSSIVSNQNRKPGPPMVDANGQPVFVMQEVRDANNVVTGHIPTKERATDDSKKKKFFALDVDAKTDPDGASVRVWREA